jgi:hypothetical protein
MKTLSLYQPWATLVVIGAKKFETRSWATNYRGPLLIHASKKFTREDQRLCYAAPFSKYVGGHFLDRGAILGRVELVDCITTEEWLKQNTQPAGPIKRLVLVDTTKGEELFLKQTSAEEYHFGDFSYGRFAWKLENPIEFDEPIAAKGSLGLWEFPESALGHLAEKKIDEKSTERQP